MPPSLAQDRNNKKAAAKKIFLGKLWLRIKGERIIFRDDLSPEKAPESQATYSRPLSDIQRQWPELVKQRDETNGRDDASEPPPPNPRTLG